MEFPIKLQSGRPRRVSEEERLDLLCRYETELFAQGVQTIAGVDEVGRGPLAGPVLACAVILPKGFRVPGVNDSKKLSPQKRETLAAIIQEKALAVSVGMSGVSVIDEINILQAAMQAMTKAVNGLPVKPEFLLIDAMQLPLAIPQKSIVHGDALSISIAAASIVAKVIRDAMMRDYHQIYPEYGFDAHKGYGTARHIQEIREHGLCPVHRQSFAAKFTQDC
ncbi:MAG: ribonuclease HII [Clostridiales bacterium]|jgi:ribonuclease HII|nr:ribonuclease HII [Clostridiales bacterium]